MSAKRSLIHDPILSSWQSKSVESEVHLCYTPAVIVETLPEVLALPTEQKEILAEELLNQVVLEKDKDPALIELLRRRLADHNADPGGGLRWEELRDRLLKRPDA